MVKLILDGMSRMLLHSFTIKAQATTRPSEFMLVRRQESNCTNNEAIEVEVIDIDQNFIRRYLSDHLGKFCNKVKETMVLSSNKEESGTTPRRA